MKNFRERVTFRPSLKSSDKPHPLLREMGTGPLLSTTTQAAQTFTTRDIMLLTITLRFQPFIRQCENISKIGPLQLDHHVTYFHKIMGYSGLPYMFVCLAFFYAPVFFEAVLSHVG